MPQRMNLPRNLFDRLRPMPSGNGPRLIPTLQAYSGLQTFAARAHRPSQSLGRVGNLEVDAVRHRATRAGAEIKLTPKEFELLSFLARHAGRVVTHKQILTAVWGPAHTEDTQYLRVYVGQLRQKIEEHADDPRIILTEPGIGYRVAEN